MLLWQLAVCFRNANCNKRVRQEFQREGKKGDKFKRKKLSFPSPKSPEAHKYVTSLNGKVINVSKVSEQKRWVGRGSQRRANERKGVG